MRRPRIPRAGSSSDLREGFDRLSADRRGRLRALSYDPSSVVGVRLPARTEEVAREATSDGRTGKTLRAANPDDELNRPFDLEERTDLLAPRILLKGVRHRVMCHPQFGCPKESTQVDGSGVEQRPYAAIGADNHQEAGATVELSPGSLDRRPPKGRPQRLLLREGGVPHRLCKR